MAATIKIYRFTYENGQSFKLDRKVDDGSYVTIVDMDENGNIGKLFDGGFTDAINGFMATELAAMVDAMKAS